MEDILEEERAKLPPGGRPVTAESFAEWRIKVETERAKEKEQEAIERREAVRGGARLTGRELLQNSTGSMFHDGEEADAGEVDLLALRKAKLLEEEAIDAENARLAAELAAEWADAEVDDPNFPPPAPKPSGEAEVTVDESLFLEEDMGDEEEEEGEGEEDGEEGEDDDGEEEEDQEEKQ